MGLKALAPQLGFYRCIRILLYLINFIVSYMDVFIAEADDLISTICAN